MCQAGPVCIARYARASLCVSAISGQTHEVRCNAAHLQRIAAVVRAKKCGNLAPKPPAAPFCGEPRSANSSLKGPRVPSDRGNCLGPPALKMAQGDTTLPRQFGIGRGALEVNVEDRSAQLFPFARHRRGSAALTICSSAPTGIDIAARASGS